MLLFELIQVALGKRERLSHILTVEEWGGLYNETLKQAVAGVAFEAIRKLPKEQWPPQDLLFEWIGISEQIKQRNLLLNSRCEELLNLFESNGYESCILKGQGNSLMYPNPLLRTSGDIDIWINSDKAEIIKFCLSKTESCELSHHHIQFPLWNDIDVEVHFYPSYSNVPRFFRRSTDYFQNFQRVEIDGRGLIPNRKKLFVPPKSFNLVFQLSHMMRHFLSGGIGLRHVIDYYYLLLSEDNFNKGEVRNTLRYLGLYKFTGAVMWILKEKLGAEEKFLLTPVDCKRGRLLLAEIEKCRNFGHFDTRFSGHLKKYSSTLSVIVRNTKLIWLFPEEAIFSPFVGVLRYLISKK